MSNNDDMERYTTAQDVLLEKLPRCHSCEKPIRDIDALHYTAKGLDIWLCRECIDGNMELIEVFL